MRRSSGNGSKTIARGGAPCKVYRAGRKGFRVMVGGTSYPAGRSRAYALDVLDTIAGAGL